MPDLTQASATEYDNILHGQMTPAIAAEYLREERIILRTFGDVLHEVYPDPDIFTRLVDFFNCDCGEPNLASTQRKIRNWIADKHPPSNREDIFKIAFALGLNESKLNYLLGMCGDYGIQYRDGQELVFAWFLRTGRSYREAIDFYASLPHPEDTLEQVQDRELTQLTHEIQYQVSKLASIEDLQECYFRNLENFGRMHLRAYFYFEQFINLLIRPQGWDGKEEGNYSVETIMDVYLSMHMPSGKKRDGYSLVQKLIKKNWPNATSIKNIRNHKEDVSRKLLLLLYVVTENEGIVEDRYDYYDETLTIEDRIEDHWWTINAMLSDCGMAPLDLRNASDWLILYAISADEDTPMSERLEQVITYMFEDKEDDSE